MKPDARCNISHVYNSHNYKNLPARLKQVLILTLGVFLAELIGSLLSNSLALLSDAIHMLTDLTALGISFTAARLARIPSSKKHTFGYYRVETLAALFNGVLLLATVFFLLREAWSRLTSPLLIHPIPMISVAMIGLGANILAISILYKHRNRSINLKSAFVHVFSDTLGSIVAIVAGFTILAHGPLWIDSAMTLATSSLIFYSSLRILRETLNILLESTPNHVDIDNLTHALSTIPGIISVHDLHVWTVTDGVAAMTGHAIINDLSKTHQILTQAQNLVASRFHIHHMTLQLECCDRRPFEPPI